MMTPLPALAFGFVLGMRHATDADHIAAISTVAGGGRSARRAAVVGAWWGVGHSVSVLLVGGALVLFKLPMPVRLALALEFLVALMLIGLGARSLQSKAAQVAVPLTRPFSIGVMHGLAGSAVLALLVLSATDSALASLVYLVSFCIGTVGGMAVVTSIFAVPAIVAPVRALRFERGVRVLAGVASIAIGLLLAHRVGVTDGLFAATPTAQGDANVTRTPE
jgi:high-affinity nickel-transport protein